MSYLILPTDIERHLIEHLFSISCLIIVKFEACGFSSALWCLRRLFMVFVSWDMLYRLLFCFILFSCDFIYLYFFGDYPCEFFESNICFSSYNVFFCPFAGISLDL